MAYRALTQDYYVFFGIDKDAIMWNEDDTYNCLDKKKISQFSYISYDEKFEAYGKQTNLHDFFWHLIEKFAREAKKRKFLNFTTMKELSIEQKAQRYDEAIERARKEYKNHEAFKGFCEMLVHIFPELKKNEDSEDERIRKHLIGVVELYYGNTDEQEKKDCLAWLEKQGEKIIPLEEIILNVWELGNYWKELTKGVCNTEYGRQLDYIVKHWKEGEHYIKHFEKQCDHKPADKVEPKFKIGDWVIVSTTKGDKVVQIASVEHFKDGYPSYITTEGRWFGNGSKARLLTDKDMETITLPESRVIVNQKPAEWSEEDEFYINQLIVFCEKCMVQDSNAKKCANWLKSLKDRVQPMQEWCEGDEKVLHAIRNALNYEKPRNYLKSRDFEFTDILDWLKSLRPQNRWKPSDEQIKAVKEAACYSSVFSEKTIDNLISLSKQLKKLREE